MMIFAVRNFNFYIFCEKANGTGLKVGSKIIRYFVFLAQSKNKLFGYLLLSPQFATQQKRKFQNCHFCYQECLID